MSSLTSVLSSRYNVDPSLTKKIVAAYEAEKEKGGTEAELTAAAVVAALDGKSGEKRTGDVGVSVPVDDAPLSYFALSAARHEIGRQIISAARTKTLSEDIRPYSTAVIGAMPRKHVQRIFEDHVFASILFEKTTDTPDLLVYSYGEWRESWNLCRFFGWDAPLISQVPDDITRTPFEQKVGGGKMLSWASVDSVEVKLAKGMLTVKTRTSHGCIYTGSWDYVTEFGERCTSCAHCSED
jgi:hypothetical protein